MDKPSRNLVENPLTEEEEADEIVRRLSAPPSRPRTLEDELAEAMSNEIQREIDEEILKALMGTHHGNKP